MAIKAMPISNKAMAAMLKICQSQRNVLRDIAEGGPGSGPQHGGTRGSGPTARGDRQADKVSPGMRRRGAMHRLTARKAAADASSAMRDSLNSPGGRRFTPPTPASRAMQNSITRFGPAGAILRLGKAIDARRGRKVRGK